MSRENLKIKGVNSRLKGIYIIGQRKAFSTQKIQSLAVQRKRLTETSL